MTEAHAPVAPRGKPPERWLGTGTRDAGATGRQALDGVKQRVAPASRDPGLVGPDRFRVAVLTAPPAFPTGPWSRRGSVSGFAPGLPPRRLVVERRRGRAHERPRQAKA